MEIQAAVTAFSQSEKVKAGLLWASHCIDVFSHLTELDKRGAEKIIKVMVSQVAGEIQFVGRITGDPAWEKAAGCMETAIVMINSGVAAEAGYHMTRAMSHVTSIGQRSMTRLKEEGVL